VGKNDPIHKGSNAVTKAATEVTYKTVWVAGPTIETHTAIRPVTAIVDVLTA
jgi:nitronate monooxygenase